MRLEARWPAMLALTVSYVIVGRLGLMLDAVGGFATLVWAPTGLALAALFKFGLGLWPGVLTGALIVNLWVGASVPVAAGIAIGNALEALLGVHLLRQLPDFSAALDRRRDVLALILRAALLATLVSATVGVTSLVLGGVVPGWRFFETWQAWWLGDVMGALVVAPVLLTWTTADRVRRRRAKPGEALLLALSLVALGFIAFGLPLSDDLLVFERAYIFFPALTWAALRFGQRGTTLATLCVSLVAIVGTALGRGPFSVTSLSASLFALQIFMGITTVTFLLLAAVTSERNTAIERLEQARENLEEEVLSRTRELTEARDALETRVEQRTLELSRVNATLRASEARKAAILEASLDGIVTMDHRGKIVDFNPAAERAFGYSESAIVGGDLADHLIPAGMRDAHRRGLAHYLATGQGTVFGHRLEFPALRADGSDFPAELALVPVSLVDSPPWFVAFVRDLTGRKAAERDRVLLEQRMQEGQKLESLGVLAGGIAHDFNNILATILGNASLARVALKEDVTALQHIGRIEEASRRATDLCRQMLAYAGRGRFVLQSTDLNRLIEDTTHLLQISISKKALLRFQLEDALPAMVADATQIRQVVMNLVINASDAIGDRSGVISVCTGLVRADRAYLTSTFLAPDIAEGDYVYLEVSDTGVGMSAETQAHIFEPFFSTKFAGRGLGLSAVLGIVRGHKGALKVYSEVSKGTSFKLLFPVAPADHVADSSKPPGARPRLEARGSILVVDDEETVRAVAGRMLETLGFGVLLAADGREALGVFRAHQAEIVGVVMDLTMPHLDGEETFRELRLIEPKVRVLLMSGYNEQEAIARFVGKGLAGFIQKPFDIDELEGALGTILG